MAVSRYAGFLWTWLVIWPIRFFSSFKSAVSIRSVIPSSTLTQSNSSSKRTTPASELTSATESELSIRKACEFSLTNSELEDIMNIEAMNMDPDKISSPCGVLPRFYPSDNFLSLENTRTLIKTNITAYGIWSNDTRYEYKDPDKSSGIITWMSVQTERFSSWMVI